MKGSSAKCWAPWVHEERLLVLWGYYGNGKENGNYYSIGFGV